MARKRKIANYRREYPQLSRAREQELRNSYRGYRRHRVDLSEIIVAEVVKQCRGCSFRPYYITTIHECRDCGIEFLFSAEEQRLWFEVYEFFIDAHPVRCLKCRRALRHDRVKKKRYDSYPASQDGELTIEQCKEVAQLIVYLFGPELDEKLKSRYHRMMNRINA